MPDKARLIQKKWQVLTKTYMNYSGSAVIASTVSALSPCPPCGGSCPSYLSIVNGDKAWTVYAESTSFLEIKDYVRDLLYTVGLKKEHIKVVEVVDHDYIITPLT